MSKKSYYSFDDFKRLKFIEKKTLYKRRCMFSTYTSYHYMNSWIKKDSMGWLRALMMDTKCFKKARWTKIKSSSCTEPSSTQFGFMCLFLIRSMYIMIKIRYLYRIHSNHHFYNCWKEFRLVWNNIRISHLLHGLQ